MHVETYMPVYVKLHQGTQRCPLTKLLKGLLLWWEGCGGRSSVCLCISYKSSSRTYSTWITFKNGIEVGDLTKKKKKFICIQMKTTV